MARRQSVNSHDSYGRWVQPTHARNRLNTDRHGYTAPIVGDPEARLDALSGDIDVDMSRLPDLHPAALALLRAWEQKALPGGTSRLLPAELLRKLLAAPAGQKGLARTNLVTLTQLGFIAPYSANATQELAQFFHPRTLERTHLAYVGHASRHMATFFNLARGFSLGRYSVLQSAYSNETATITAFRAQTDASGGVLFLDKRLGDGKSAVPQFADCLEQAVASCARRPGSGEHVVIDKGASVLAALSPEKRKRIQAAIDSGALRFILHNIDDVNAAQSLPKRLWGVNLAGALIKKLEARFIGEAYALIGAREVRTNLGARIGDAPVTIVGFGLLGEQLARALKRLKMPPGNIHVVDPSAAARQRAQKLGLQVHASCAELGAAHIERNTVYIATPAKGLRAEDVPKLGREVVVLCLTSGGKGVDMEELRTAATTYSHRKSAGFNINHFQDYELVFGASKVQVLAEGYPLNLLKDMWPDRHAVTTIAILASTLVAAGRKQPGIAPIPKDVDRALVRVAVRQGLLSTRPLDRRATDAPEDLHRDLSAFHPLGPTPARTP